MKRIFLGLIFILSCTPGTGFAANIDTTGTAQTPADGTKLYGQNAAGEKGYVTGSQLKTYVGGLTSLPTATNQIVQANGVGTYAWTSSVAGLIDDTATNGDTDKLWSADKIFDSLALKEPSLGNPGTDAYVLSSTAAGVRSWVANGSGSMTWPAAAGIAVYSGSSTWGTSLTAPSGAIVGTTDAQALSSKSMTGTSYPVSVSTTTATGNINIDGVSADHYYFNNGATAATYTPVITSPPASGFERAIILTVGGGVGVDTMTWTNVSFIGTAGAAATTASKYSHYGCIIPSSGNAKCVIIAEASDY